VCVCFRSQNQPHQRTSEVLAATMARFENITMIKERVVNRHDVMVPPSRSFMRSSGQKDGYPCSPPTMFIHTLYVSSMSTWRLLRFLKAVPF